MMCSFFSSELRRWFSRPCTGYRRYGYLDKKSKSNAEKIVKTINAFGFSAKNLSKDIFLKRDNVIRMGITPFRIEILTDISAVNFNECYKERIVQDWNETKVPVISLEKLIKNKKASGRHKDLTVKELEKLL